VTRFCKKNIAFSLNKHYNILLAVTSLGLGENALTRKRWQVAKPDIARDALAKEFAAREGLPGLAVFLAGRRLQSDEEDLAAFFGVGEPALANPFDFPDMERAAERIEAALAQGEKIAVYGDYDCDGITATALLISYLRTKTEQVRAYIPDRQNEGFGLSMCGVDALHEDGFTLIITVDNGIAACKEIEHANALGMTVVVTDHHEPGETLPAAYAIVNPKRHDCTLEYKHFAGVSVAFHLICALECCDAAELDDCYTDLVALGTIADIVPLTNANRTLVQAGLRRLNHAPRVGITALRRCAGLHGDEISSGNIAFQFAPRINAAGRVGNAEKALALLLATNAQEAEEHAVYLQSCNEERQTLERGIYKEVLRTLEENPARRYDRVVVAAGKNWHEGVLGIVAARLLETLGKPCILLCVKDGIAKGSGRSLPGFHLFDAITRSEALMTKYGGHECAAGLTMAAQFVDLFREEINAYAAKQEMPFAVQTIDATLNPAKISLPLVDALRLLEPFGAGNPQPVFALRGMFLLGAAPVSQGKHMRLHIQKAEVKLTAMCFGCTPQDFIFLPGDEIDLAVVPEENNYMGKRDVSLYVQNMKFSALPNEVILQAGRRVAQVLRRDALPPHEKRLLCPTRDDAASMYRILRQNAGKQLVPERFFLLLGNAFLQTADIYAYAKIWLALHVLCEARLAAESANGAFSLAENPVKTDLQQTATMRFLSEASPGQ
jgi:single-stranded-DNA-specific exonuclease